MARPESYTGTITNRKSDEVKTIMDSVARIDELKPETTDEETFKKLIDVVTEARFRNESISTIKENVIKLEDSVVSLFREKEGKATSLS